MTTQEEARDQILTLRCQQCGTEHQRLPTSLMQDPLTGYWFGLVDAEDLSCSCPVGRWRYVR